MPVDPDLAPEIFFLIVKEKEHAGIISTGELEGK